MTKRNQKATVWQGTKKYIWCRLTKNGAPFILTGATILYSLTDTTTDKIILMYDNAEEGGVIVIKWGTEPGALFSLVGIKYDPEDTKTLTPGDNYRHELSVTEDSGEFEVYMQGPVSVVETDTLKTPPVEVEPGP
jgi:hypothetical protein